MGDIRKYICKCGYSKEVYAGGGLNGCNISEITRFFPDVANTFLNERAEGRVKRFMMENELFHCARCQEIMTLPVFTYARKDGSSCRYQSNCPICKETVAKVEDDEKVLCPKCGRRMDYMVTGNWD